MYVTARRLLVVSALTLLAAGCGGDSGTEPKQTITGTWNGTITGSAGSGTMSLTLTQSGTQVTGAGSLSAPLGSAAITASGTFSAPTLSLNLSATGFQSINFTGTVNGNSMTGTMNGSGFQNYGVTLTRQ